MTNLQIIDDIENVKMNQNDDDLLTVKLSKLSEGLIYLSETDANFSIVKGGTVEILSNENIENLVKQVNGSPNVPYEVQNFDDFFLRLTTIKDWFGDFEKNRAKRFSEMQVFLKLNLKNLTVIRIGRINIDIYILGISNENRLFGLKTNAVET